MTIWLTSDEHYGHKNIIKHTGRPFSDVEEMNEELVARHNAVVSEGDVVWHLGDFTMDHRLMPQWLRRLNGTHHLIVGNHDKCHPCHSESARWTRWYLEAGWASVQLEYRLECGRVLLTHFPDAGDLTRDPRYQQWRPDVSRVDLVLCGHVHEAWLRKGKCLNVGVDQWGFKPVALERMIQMGYTVCG